MEAPNIPTITVIVPAYGVAEYLGEALLSLQQQDFGDWEAIVIDDGSPDDIAGVLARFAGDTRIRLLATDNQGVSVARNRGIAAARAPLIALLDGDDAYAPDYLTAMKAAIDADPGLGFVCCDAIYCGATALAGRRFSQQSRQAPPVTLARVLARDFNVFTAALMRRAAFDAAGGYDPALRSAEDLDLWIRILSGPWTAGYVPRPLARYRRRAGSLSSATGGMLPMVAHVYAKAEAALAGRTEAAVAAATRRSVEQRICWDAGDAMIRQGRVREGLGVLRESRAAERSPRWRVAMPLMQAMPAIARPLLNLRWRHQDS